eukprot:jgi/Ulvmu1/5657/UM024_0004.1
MADQIQGYSVVQSGVNETPALATLREHVDSTNSTVAGLRQRLQSRCEVLQQTVEDARAVLDDAGTNPLPATKESIRQLLAYAHRLGYSTFLPLLGEHLVEAGVAQHFRPSLAHLQNSQLKHSAIGQEAAKAKAKADAAARAEAAAAAPLATLPLPVMPADWKPGDPIPMPAGWAPDGTAPLPPAALPPSVSQIQEALAPPPAAAVAAADTAMADVAAAAALDLDAGIDDDFVLNAEAISGSEEESSDDEEDEEDEDEEEEEGRSGGSRPVTESEMRSEGRSGSGTEGDGGGSDDDDGAAMEA